MDNFKRLESLDTLRGIDMLFLMGLEGFILSIGRLFPGGDDWWFVEQTSHVAWNGFHIEDLIFPLFLFIAGISFPFSYAKQCRKGASRSQIYLKIFRRGLLLVLLGLVCNGLLRFNWGSLRICSVLGRIGMAWMFAALLFINFKPRTRAMIAAALLVGYRLLLLIPAPDVPGADPLSREGNIVGYIDHLILGASHIYANGSYDPEGILSTIPAVVTAMLGMFTGEFVKSPEEKMSGNRKTLWMFGAAAVMLVLGIVWNHWFPVNKKLWTSSFVLVAGGVSLILFALMYWIVDVRGWRKWTFPFRVVGMNSITIFLAPRLISFSQAKNFLLGGIIDHCPDAIGSVISSAGYMAVIWLFLYFLYRKKIFLRV